MSALANRKRPRTLQDVKGHTVTVTTLSLVIANDLWSVHSPLFLQGSPGSGKTSIALLCARATLCPNREPGTSNNCGTCDTCMGKDTTNIIQYTCTGADAEAISNLIDIGRTQPLPKESSLHSHYRFFILDEVSNMTNQQLSKFLEVLEGTNPYNVWVLVSMRAEKMDDTLSNALLSRCSTFSFPPLTDMELTDTLVSGGVGKGIATAIAPHCKGNARLAWRKYDSLLLLNPEATPEWVEAHLTGGATHSSRVTMWRLLREGKVKQVIDLVGGWNCDNDTLTSLVRGDIVTAMCQRSNLLPVQARLLQAVTQGSSEDILYILLSWCGKDILCGPVNSPPIDTPIESSSKGASLSPWSVLRDKYELLLLLH
jgi:DNA polymerase III, delta subunit